MAKKPKVERSKATGRTKEEIFAEYKASLAGLDPNKFENESDGEDSDRTEAMDQEEVEAIDEMLEGKDEKFNKLKY